MDSLDKQIDFEVSPKTYAKIREVADREGRSIERYLLRLIAEEKENAEVPILLPPR